MLAIVYGVTIIIGLASLGLAVFALGFLIYGAALEVKDSFNYKPTRSEKVVSTMQVETA